MTEKPNGTASPETRGGDGFPDFLRDGLRTRYCPPCRINAAFVSVVPWMNVIVLAMAFAFFYGNVAEVPGMVVDLPEQEASAGMRSSLVVVAKDMARKTAASGAASADEPESDESVMMRPMRLVVFFKHREYDLSQPHHIATFRNDVASAISREGETEVLLYLDKHVTHENTMRMTSLLREAGTTRVCYVVRTP